MSAEAILVGVIAGVIAAVLGGLALAEARGWLPHIHKGFVDRAVRKLPEGARLRYAEEWRSLLADLSDRPITASVHAVSLYLRAGALAAELEPAPQTAGPAKSLPRRGAARLFGSASAAGSILRRVKGPLGRVKGSLASGGPLVRALMATLQASGNVAAALIRQIARFFIGFFVLAVELADELVDAFLNPIRGRSRLWLELFVLAIALAVAVRLLPNGLF